MNIKDKIIIAVPKGRILKELLPFFDKAGIVPEAEFFDKDSRKLAFETNDDEIKIIRVRSFDVATLVAYGGAHIGVAGSDVLQEFDYDNLYSPVDLEIGQCRMSLAALSEMAKDDSIWNASHIRVATKYPNITQEFFAKRGVQAECIKLNGAIELAPKLGLCRRIVDLVSTGSTLKANGLEEVEQIMDITSKLIVNRTAFKVKNAKISDIINKFEQAVKG